MFHPLADPPPPRLLLTTARVCAAMGGCVGVATALVAIVPLAARMATMPEERAQVPAILIVGTVGLALATAGVIGAAIASRRPATGVALLLTSACGGFLVFNPVVWFVPAVLQVAAAAAVWRGQRGYRE